jgi:dolichyl-phosphate-mannose--protein O-mannosyl transferase
MSWQEMESDKMDMRMGGYEGVPHNTSYTGPSFGQKLSTGSTTSLPSWGHRVTLAIVSLVLWIIVFVIVIMIVTTTPAQIIVSGPNALPTIVDNSKALYTITFLLSSGLLIFSAIVLLINIRFHRK